MKRAARRAGMAIVAVTLAGLVLSAVPQWNAGSSSAGGSGVADITWEKVKPAPLANITWESKVIPHPPKT